MQIIQQDMLELRSGVLFHQVNCEGFMGGGIARALADKYPSLEEKYRDFCDSTRREGDDRTLLGKVQLVQINYDLSICNVFGQVNTSSSSRQTSYDGTVQAFERIVHARERYTHSTFARLPLYFPYKMGCGLGGGNWNIYSAIIGEFFPDAIICKHE